MVTILNFKDKIDLPKWRPLAPSSVTVATGTSIAGGLVLISDLRNNSDRNPYLYLFAGLGSNTADLWAYSTFSDDWLYLGAYQFMFNPGSNQFVSAAAFMPSLGPVGTIAAGATTTTLTLTTALPATVGANALANKGDDLGYKIRIVGNAAGSSGKTEERLIVNNTSSTTPFIILNSPLSFSPILGDRYEFLSGKIYTLNNSNNTAYFDILTKIGSGPSNNSAPIGATICMAPMDELLVPYNRAPGEGFLGLLIATATGAASLTGQAVGGDASVLANEYRNFQIRIVQDTAIPTAAGQRRRITSHTVGASPVYTVPAWSVVPSATATYVIENPNLILAFNNSNPTNDLTINKFTTFMPNWSSGTYANQGVGRAAGEWVHQSFSIVPDANKNVRHSFFYLATGTSTAISVFDIAGAATGTWAGVVYSGAAQLMSTGTTTTQDPVTEEGRYVIINANNRQNFMKFDMLNRTLEPLTYLRVTNPAFTTCQRALVTHHFEDGATKLGLLYFLLPNTNFFNLPLSIG